MPVWFMRQAGRYQPEYREIRKNNSLLEICRQPELCAHVTTLPVEQLGVDAGILFSDITLPLEPMGIRFEIKEGVGPVIFNPIATEHDVDSLRPVDAERNIDYVGETIGILSRDLPVPLIGFVGAPFTLASYMIEGGPSKNYYNTKRMMYNSPEVWHKLMHFLAVQMGDYLAYQIRKGCAAVQVFDSWVGSLSIADYEQYIFPHMETLFSRLTDYLVPKIHFGVNTAHLLHKMETCGATVVGLDWRTSVGFANSVLSKGTVTQGNIDPALLLAPWDIVQKRIDELLQDVSKRPHIFNLGHGIMPQATSERLRKITQYVHEQTS